MAVDAARRMLTFLFTDVEGSTKRWEESPQAMSIALRRHDDVLRQAIGACAGRVFKTVGDAFCAVFDTPDCAVQAAVDAQRILQHGAPAQPVPGPDFPPLRVRMAIHTGLAEQRDDDYFGVPLSRVARILAAGHGGQVLLSLATYELIRDSLPASVGVRSLGENRLKDLTRPEQLFQLVIPGLLSEFPPLKTLNNRPGNLPRLTSQLVGRAREIGALTALLRHDDVALVTLVGTGGTGKTRLAIQVAAEMIEHFPDGCWFVDLSPIFEPRLVLSEVAGTLGVREAGGTTLEHALRAHLRDKQLLLVLDNFEQVIDAAESVAWLLNAAPGLKVLATSREALNLYAERQYPLSPLGLPGEPQGPGEPIDPGALMRSEAAQLFVERTRARIPDFEVTAGSARAVHEICWALDGLPLALELAAGLTGHLSLREIQSQLTDRLGLLVGGSRDRTARQQTLRGAIAWSYDLLTPEQQQLFRRLGVFLGGFTLPFASSVCVADRQSEPAVRAELTRLLHKNLVRRPGGTGELDAEENPRFWLLETIQEFARAEMAAAGETEQLQRRHANAFLALAERAEPALRSGERHAALAQLDAELGNIRAALAWGLTEQGDARASLRLAGSLHWFWYLRGYLSEGRRWLGSALDSAGPGRESLEGAKALATAGRLASLQNDYQTAIAHLEESVRIWRELGEQNGLAYALTDLGSVTVYLARDAASGGHLLVEEALSIFRATGDRWGLAYALDVYGDITLFLTGDDRLTSEHKKESLRLYRDLRDDLGIAWELSELGHIALRRDDYQTALANLQEALDRFRTEEGDRVIIAHTLRGLGDAAFLQGDLSRARELYQESLRLFGELGDRLNESFALRKLGQVAVREGSSDRAAELYKQALQVTWELRSLPNTAIAVAALGGVALARGEMRRACLLYGAADAQMKASRAIAPRTDQELYDRSVAELRRTVAEAVRQELWREGEAMTLEEAVALALEE